MKKYLGACALLAGVVGFSPAAWADYKLETSSGSSVYDSASGSVVVDPNIKLEGSQDIGGMIVSFADGFVPGEDELSCTQAHGISCSYDSSAGELTLSGNASVDNYQSVLRSVSYSNTSSAATTGTKRLRFRVGTQTVYLEDTDHFYEYIADDGIYWEEARDAAEARSYYGLQGYLVTVGSAEEDEVAGDLAAPYRAWMGSSDAAVPDDWRWVTGPEGLEDGGQGQLFWQGQGNSGQPVGGAYTNWDDGEPNDNKSGEEYGHFLGGTNLAGDPAPPEQLGLWNDVSGTTDTINGYVVEYGGMPGEEDIVLVDHRLLHVNLCDDGAKNGDETDVDCGGSICGPCDDDLACQDDTDCVSGVCEGGVCQPAACDDGVQNGTETDVDCGGDDCQGCDVDEKCNVDSDCLSGVCDEDDGVCLAPTCDDGIQNGDETDVDCGGSCGGCDTDEMCEEDADCLSGVCDEDDGVCLAPTCDDGVQNGTETDVDCGGDSCQTCQDGDSCLEGSDCDSGVCSDENTCVPATCDDDELNGDETDVDCGGSCSRCDDGKVCEENSDCKSGHCDSGICEPATCDDEIQNGDETDVDCGGDTCEACEDGKSCEEDSDCLSDFCSDDKTCVSESCNDGELNGDETDVDCGGSCGACDEGKMCEENSDCASDICADGICIVFTLDKPEEGAVTNNPREPITGTATPGATITINANGQTGEVTADEDGNWSWTPDEDWEEGEITVEAGTGDHSDTVTFTVDTTAPEVEITDIDDEGVLTGTTEPGAEVEVTVNGEPAGTTTADEDGNFSVDISESLDEGDNSINVTARDEAGNEGEDNATYRWGGSPDIGGVLTGGGGCSSTGEGLPALPILLGFGLLVGGVRARKRR